ncbi:MAG: class I SAM-dependent rRNA methyltransferase [Neomegalonema sp.]|nr:class I SAM-dependent rRNA methyltransferase [Neomegalonema sp.]
MNDLDSNAPALPGGPIVKLKPKMGGRFFAGAPWIYANEIALDRRTRGVEPGSIVTIIDSARQPLGRFAFNPDSTIAARLLDRDPQAEIDVAWLTDRLRRALELRERLFDAPVYRLCHAESDGLPGLIIDRYGDSVVVQPNAAWLERLRTALLAALEAVVGPKTVVWSGMSRARAMERLPQQTRVLVGAAERPVEVALNGAKYFADLAGGQKTGFFLDQRETHRFVGGLSKGGDVLDVFCHVGGFGLAALAAGAARAVGVDASAPALELARQGAEAMGAADRYETEQGDAFDMMRRLKDAGRSFDTVVIDPPAFAPNRQALDAGLRAYEKAARMGVALTRPGAVFSLCSCSHPVSQSALEDIAARVLHKAGRRARLLRVGGAGPDHPSHPALLETRYLKTLVYLLD